MKVAIIGAGIVGVTSAYELARDGHAVTVFERHSAVAEECSFAHAGIIAPGYITPLAAPGMPTKILQHLFSHHTPVRIGLPLSGAELTWLWQWLRACKLPAYQSNRSHLVRLAAYSRERLHGIVKQHEFDYERSDGHLVLLRSDKERKAVAPSLQFLRETGVLFKELDAAAARVVEPALCADTPLQSAIHLPHDEAGNCRQFALLLRAEAQKLGAKFEFDTAVDWPTAQNPRLLRLNRFAHGMLQPAALPTQHSSTPSASAPIEQFDTVVLCAGVGSAALLQSLGVQLPLAAVYGYSLSANLREPMDAPRSAIMDERYQVTITRLGHRVRVAGGTELGGRANQKRKASIQTLYKVLQDWFPGAAQHSNVQEWKGARPALPDGSPIIGESGLPGLLLNVGHGSNGWALACGSARVLADSLAKRATDIDMQGFDLSRLKLKTA
jgi:D-amino-acid dehydrogenase